MYGHERVHSKDRGMPYWLKENLHLSPAPGCLVTHDGNLLINLSKKNNGMESKENNFGI